jgi:coenzyme F420-dependent glucose-6-phosphate dehydrogenase
VDVGYAISSEEHRPLDLVRHARRAEECGFPFALISDHYHPWIDRQGQSAFVWAVIGGIADATDSLRLGTGVTCPTIRMHPALVAQAAATAADMLPGRFFLGVGTGENLNEHILGDRWPSASERLEMLEEAVEVMRLLWRGEVTTFEGKHFRVEDARVYTLPDDPLEVVVAAAAPDAAELAARIGDGVVSTAPDRELVDTFLRAGGEGPRYGQLTVCWAQTEEEARRTAYELWPIAALEGPLTQELPLPGGDDLRGRRRRACRLRAGRRSTSRGHPGTRRRGLRPRLRPPGRPRPGRLLRLLHARGAPRDGGNRAAARSRARRARLSARNAR